MEEVVVGGGGGGGGPVAWGLSSKYFASRHARTVAASVKDPLGKLLLGHQLGVLYICGPAESKRRQYLDMMDTAGGRTCDYAPQRRLFLLLVVVCLQKRWLAG